MTSPRLTAATALLAALGLAACSDGGGGATTATPASGITSAATSAATEPASPSDAFPTAGGRPADAGRRRHRLPRRDLGARAAAGPGLQLPADGGDRPRRQAVEVDVPARRPQGQGRRGVELGRGRARDAARGLLGDQVDHQHPGRHGAGRRRPRRRRPGQALHRGVARHEVPVGHDPRHPQQRQRPVLGHRHRLRRPAPGRGPHAVRDRPRPAVPAGQGVDLQQRGHPDPRPGGLDGDRSGDPRRSPPSGCSVRSG